MPFLQNPPTIRSVADCPHVRCDEEQPWVGMGAMMRSCLDCGTTLTRPAPEIEGYEASDWEDWEEPTENPPWTDRILRNNAEEINSSGLPRPANRMGYLKGAPHELGSGSYGAVYTTTDSDTVFKVTSDLTEINFVHAAMEIGHWPIGIVEYLAVIDFPEKFRNRATFGIWREAAFPVGLQDGMDHAKDTYEEVQLQEFNIHLRWFLANAAFARNTLKTAKNPARVFEESKRYEQWARDMVGPAHATPPWKWSAIPDYYAKKFKGAQRVAAALRACEYIAEVMGSTDKMNYVGDALTFYLDQGILLADVHGDNVGLVDRDDMGTIWVITDPGHAVFLNELEGSK